jgi:hypothetical protein
MAISESQLETWSHQGSITQSAATYGTIKRALEAQDAGYAGRTFEVFLQGSYGNDTNIYSESDVDVVIRCDATFFHDLDDLTEQERQAFHAAFGNGSYSHSDYKAHVVRALTNAFGNSVKPDKKAIKVAANGARRSADVIPAMQFRRYRRFKSFGDQDFEPGICFFTNSGERIENFPKQHSENLTTKHRDTNQMFKPLVRILKNMRTRMVESGMITDGIAPSYFIEGLLYNVPKEHFAGDYTDAFTASINWILKADRTKFVCANEQYYLLRETSVTWPPANCDQFLDALVKLWREW